MASKTDIIFIPYWVYEALKRRGLPIAVCLDFPKVSHLLAPNELISFAGLQGYDTNLMGCTEQVTPRNCGLEDQWLKSLGSNMEKEGEIRSTFAMSYDPSFTKELEARLFDPESKQDQYEKAVITYDLSPSAVGVVIYPGFFSKVTLPAVQQELVTAVLNALYVYNEYHEVARTPWFKRQLELLSV